MLIKSNKIQIINLVGHLQESMKSNAAINFIRKRINQYLIDLFSILPLFFMKAQMITYLLLFSDYSHLQNNFTNLYC